jgi:beta-glucosidase
VVDEQGAPLLADVGIVVIGEEPYAEGLGDRGDLRIPQSDVTLIEHVKAQSKKVVVILLSGRPLVVTEHLPEWDAFVAAWLPGSEGAGVADVLFGDYDFTGKLPYTWPRSNAQLPFDFQNLPTEGCDAPLYPYDFGLSVNDPSPIQLDCPLLP